jgi:hypothetical protein
LRSAAADPAGGPNPLKALSSTAEIFGVGRKTGAITRSELAYHPAEGAEAMANRETHMGAASTRKATANRDRGRFTPGRSGNPNGRPRGRTARPRHLPIADAVTAARLAHAGVAPRKIAKLLSARPEAVREALEGARKLLELFAPEFAQHWLEASRNAAVNGDHRPAMAALLATKVIEPIPQVYETGGGANADAAMQVEFHVSRSRVSRPHLVTASPPAGERP